MALADASRAIALRTAGPEDAAAIAALHGQVFPKPWNETDIRALLGGAGAIGLLATLAGTPAGFLLARAPADEAEVISVGVGYACRRHGVATHLLERLHALLAAGRCAAVFLEVDENNAGAVRLYRALGYVRVGLRREYYKTPSGRRTNALVLKKALAN